MIFILFVHVIQQKLLKNKTNEEKRSIRLQWKKTKPIETKRNEMERKNTLLDLIPD